MTDSITYKVAHNGFFVKSLERPTLNQAQSAIESYARSRGFAQEFRTHYFDVVESIYSEQDSVKTTATKEVFSTSY